MRYWLPRRAKAKIVIKSSSHFSQTIYLKLEFLIELTPTNVQISVGHSTMA